MKKLLASLDLKGQDRKLYKQSRKQEEFFSQ
jgi:hypothetical protein